MDKKIIKLLEDIKKLIILNLIEKGIQANTVADILDVDKATISRIVPARKIKRQNEYGKKSQSKNSPKADKKN